MEPRHPRGVLRAARAALVAGAFLLVTCEHGGNRVPKEYRRLFAGWEPVLASHRGYDPGALTLARELADEWEKRDNLRVNAVVPGPIRSPLRGQSHPAEDITRLPMPDMLVPLYLHLIAGQTKAESGALIDAQAWLAGAPSESSLRP